MKWLAAALLPALVATPLSGQTCEDGLPPQGTLGVGQWVCDGGACSINQRDARGYHHSFSVEPRVGRVDSRSGGPTALREGDVIVTVDDLLITTPEGGRRLASIEKGEPVRLTVRRGGAELDVSGIAGETCRLPSLLVRSGGGSAYAYQTGPSVRGWVRADSVHVESGNPAARGRGASPWAGGRVAIVGDTVVVRGSEHVYEGGTLLYSDAEGTWAVGGRTVGVNGRIRGRPPVELGVDLDCGSCGFRTRGGQVVFETDVFPVVLAVEADGPAGRAGMRVDDVLLTVAGRPITAGVALADLTPGSPVAVEVRRGDRIVRLEVEPRRRADSGQRW